MARTEKVSFRGSQGDLLAARLDRPAGEPKAFALFAHCFTCSKDTFAASRIANELAARGFAVLRFDFTGLGASEGEFANTHFSSNVQDLLAAVDYLRTAHRAPALLIGHSLGGAAVLAAAPDVPEAIAVATIGAPADAAHVVHNFAAKLDEIEATGRAAVTLAGRQFTVKKEFLDDLRKHDLQARIASMRKALIIFHAPTDHTVGIENAAQIFGAAKHPKSFVSLDDADHLLSRRSDAVYVADVISAWAARFLESAVETHVLAAPGRPGVASVAETGRGKFQQEVVVDSHRLIADEPESYGGLASGPNPYDFLAIALGACTAMTLRMYGERKGLPIEHIRVDVSHAKIHAKDCAECEGREGRVDRFERTLTVRGALTTEHRTRLKEIADLCPVHKTLEKSSVIATLVADTA